MILKNDELLHEFYLLHGDKYPDLNLEQFKEITFNPWVYLRKQIESGELETVRLKYFGTFQVYPKRAQAMLANLKERLRFNKIEVTEYSRYADMLTKFLNKPENEIKK